LTAGLVNRRSAHNLGGQPALASDTLHAWKYNGVLPCGIGLAAEFVNGTIVDKPVAERRLFVNEWFFSKHCGQDTPQQAESPIHQSTGISVGN
jgi:hypothetical protein